jgi:ankyrin repeat protein
VKQKRSNKAASYDDLTNKFSSVSNKNKNVDINCRESKFQMTPLMIASLKGSREIVLFLIQYGANVSLKDIKG